MKSKFNKSEEMNQVYGIRLTHYDTTCKRSTYFMNILIVFIDKIVTSKAYI